MDMRSTRQDGIAVRPSPAAVRIGRTSCRTASGVCDVVETCDGVADDCPVDAPRRADASLSLSAIAGVARRGAHALLRDTDELVPQLLERVAQLGRVSREVVPTLGLARVEVR